MQEDKQAAEITRLLSRAPDYSAGTTATASPESLRPALRATRDLGHRTTRASSPGYATIALDGRPLELGDRSVNTLIAPGQRAPFTFDAPGNTYFGGLGCLASVQLMTIMPI